MCELERVNLRLCCLMYYASSPSLSFPWLPGFQELLPHLLFKSIHRTKWVSQEVHVIHHRCSNCLGGDRLNVKKKESTILFICSWDITVSTPLPLHPLILMIQPNHRVNQSQTSLLNKPREWHVINVLWELNLRALFCLFLLWRRFSS